MIVPWIEANGIGSGEKKVADGKAGGAIMGKLAGGKRFIRGLKYAYPGNPYDSGRNCASISLGEQRFNEITHKIKQKKLIDLFQ